MRDIGITQAMYARVFMASLLLVATLATALVYGWGGVLSVNGALDVGTVVALTAYLNRLYGPLTALSNARVDLMTAFVSFDRVFEVLDAPNPIVDRPDAGEEGGEQRGVAQLLLTDLGKDAAADEDAERREDVSPVEVAEEGPEAVDHVEEGAVRR